MTERELLLTLLNHPAGYDCGLFAMLNIRSHCDGFEVSWEVTNPTGEEYIDFDTAEEAVDFFLKKRHEFELGLDYEAAYWEKINERT